MGSGHSFPAGGFRMVVRSCQRAPVNRTDGSPAHLPVPIALLFKVRLREEKNPQTGLAGKPEDRKS